MTALTTPSLHTRALSVLFLLGTDRPGWKLPARRGEIALVFDLLDELGTAPTTLAICREGYTRGQAVASRAKTSRNQVTAPIFLLVPQVKLLKRLDLDRYAARAHDSVPGLIVANWMEERI